MSTEVWFRNADLYVRELVECGVGKIAWDRGYLVKKRIDPDKFMSLYYGSSPYEQLLIGEQGAALLDSAHPFTRPKAVYPVWTYGEDAGLLEELCKSNVGLDGKHCSDATVAPDERPVFGQEHRVIVADMPPANTGPGRKFARYLKELQEDYPDCIVHVHGLYSYQIAFGFGFRAADMEARTLAAKGKVVVPAGKEMKWEAVAAHPQWVTVLGFKPVDLGVPRNRCMYNIKSAVWAGENYTKLYKFKTAGEAAIDVTSPNSSVVQPQTNSHMSTNAKGKDGDYFACDTCSLNLTCKYSRAGAVCSVPGAEPTKLANFFQTRDSSLIIDGLGVLLGAQSRRVQKGMEEEDLFGEMDPEVTKMMNQLFTNGVKLAQLVDPTLRAGGTKVQVNVGSGGAAQVNMSNPQELMAAAVRELEARGIPREKITNEMIMGLLEGMARPDHTRAAIDSKVIEQDGSAA